MRILFLLAILCFSIQSKSQDFYDLETIQDIEITFADSNWDQLLDDAKATTEDYILAQSVTINGELFDSVGVKYKGNSTYRPDQTKNPFHIELDTYKDQEYKGYTDIKLSNVAKDPSFLREVLSYQVIRKYMDAPLSNFANVSVNGTLIGLYSNSESISKKFVKRRFGSNNNTFVKCNPPAGAGPGSNDRPDLVYLGQDSTSYYDSYELKSESGWNQLIELCDILNNSTESVEDVLDVDRTLWMLALNNVLVNLDSYIGSFAQNYYLYKDDYGRFAPVIWDLNESFGRFTNTGSGNLNNTTSKQRMDYLIHQNDSDFPLISKLLADDHYRKIYLAHYKTILQESFQNSEYFNEGMTMQTLIDAVVQADGNKFFSYNNFRDNLMEDVNAGGGGGPGGGSVVGIANLMDGRVDYILGLSDFTAVEPQITNIVESSFTPVVGGANGISATVQNADLVMLAYRTGSRGPFNKIEMYDDGNNGDQEASDGIYGAAIPLEGVTTQYYIYAENATIGKFSPTKAEHEFYEITAFSVAPGDLVINEFLASNDEVVADQDEEYDDWIELYNNGSESIDLSGFYLSDDEEELNKWSFPEGLSIDPQQYITIWTDNDSLQSGLHAYFKLSAGGETVVLSDGDGNIIDQVDFDEQETDISYGRYPNGTGAFTTMDPSFGAENMLISSIMETEDAGFSISPNPAQERCIVQLSDNNINQKLSIRSIDGRLIYSDSIKTSLSLDISSWISGMYIITVGDENRTFIISE